MGVLCRDLCMYLEGQQWHNRNLVAGKSVSPACQVRLVSPTCAALLSWMGHVILLSVSKDEKVIENWG